MSRPVAQKRGGIQRGAPVQGQLFPAYQGNYMHIEMWICSLHGVSGYELQIYGVITQVFPFFIMTNFALTDYLFSVLWKTFSNLDDALHASEYEEESSTRACCNSTELWGQL